LIERKTRGYSIRARGDESFIDRPDIWQQLSSPTAAIDEKKACKSEESIYGVRNDTR
jgi:hypothetical protein